MSSKMASTLVNHFLPKSWKFCLVRTTQLLKFHQHVVQMLIKYDVWRDCRLPTCQMSALPMVTWNADRKIIFTVNLPFKLFRATVANAGTASLKTLHTFLKKIFLPHASEIWTNSYGPNYTKFWAFWQKPLFL